MSRLAAPSLIALALACALLAGATPPATTRAAPTAVAIIACENLAPYLDGDPGDVTTAADEQAACLDPIPPTGELSIASIEQALGDGDGALTWEDLNPVDFLDHNRLPPDCTYDAVVTQQTKSAVGCALLIVGFIDGDSPVRFATSSNAALMETGADEYICLSDTDCDEDPGTVGDGVVMARLLNQSGVDGDAAFVSVIQESIGYPAEARISTATRNDPSGLTDPDGDGVPTGIDNCYLTPNPDQLNTDGDPLFIAAGLPLDATRPNGDQLGDACDDDRDNDGRSDFAEGFGCGSFTATSPILLDTDGDGVTDRAECLLNSDPRDPNVKPLPPETDTDGDGLDDNFENGMEFNRLNPDSDGDGISDGIEFKGYNTSPLHADTDGDGCPDGREIASLDGNTTVNVLDVMIVVHGMSLAPPPSALDLTKDGAINVLDLLVVAANFNGAPC